MLEIFDTTSSPQFPSKAQPPNPLARKKATSWQKTLLTIRADSEKRLLEAK